MTAPILFISHGSPMAAIEKSDYADALKLFGKSLTKPRAVIVFSAHNITQRNEVVISAGKVPPLIYDFFGFPKVLYDLHYSCPGSPEIAQEVAQLLTHVTQQPKIHPAC